MRCFACLIALLAAAAPAKAGPEAVVAALQDRPASLFDLSLARLDTLVGAQGQDRSYYGGVHYQDGQIVIWAWSLEDPVTEASCAGILDGIKRLGGVDPETGLPDDPASRFARLFSYPQLDSFAIDPTYDETVDSMFLVRATIGISGDGKAISCESPLLSQETTFSRH